MTKIPTLINNGTITVLPNEYDDIWDNVIGHGRFVVGAGATLDFIYGASAGQTIKLSNKHADGTYGAASLAINDPADFHGKIDLRYVTPPPGAPALEQSNVGLVMVSHAVDSYSYKNDMLKLWQGNTVVEALKLDVHDPYGITVQAAPGGWVFASANTPTVHGLDFVHGHPPAMAVHST